MQLKGLTVATLLTAMLLPALLSAPGCIEHRDDHYHDSDRYDNQRHDDRHDDHHDDDHRDDHHEGDRR